EYLQQLPSGTRAATETLYAAYDALMEIRDRAEQELLERSRRHSITRVLQTCPGLGPIRVAQMIPIVMTPERFRTKRQFWSYCGLGIVMRSSSDGVRSPEGKWQRAQVNRTRGLNYNHNNQLKVIFKGAATTVINQFPDEPLYADYQKMLVQGTKPNLAKLTLARKIAAITLALWKTGEEYNPEKLRRPKQISYRVLAPSNALIEQKTVGEGLHDERGSRVSIHCSVGLGVSSRRPQV